jgi:hypothetical protein
MTYYYTPAATADNPFLAPIPFDTFTAVRARRDGSLHNRPQRGAGTARGPLVR